MRRLWASSHPNSWCVIRARRREPIWLLAPLFALLIAPGARADDDHLKCFKVRDGLKRVSYTADLNGLVPQAGCLVSVPALYVCLPSDNSNLQPTPPEPGAGPPTGGFA